MFVCSCRVVSDQCVARAIDTGAETVEDIMASCGAGSGCGSCRPALQALLEAADTKACAAAA